jgi:hypothetical protein
MVEPRDDRSQARSEAAALLGVDINDMSPADGLRVDMVSALRLVIDAEQANVLSGGSADLGKLNVAVQSLIALLPGRELPAPADLHSDPRQIMFEIYMKMRRNGEINLRVPDEGPLQAKITQLESENAQLRAALGGPTTLLHGVKPSAITPGEADITPPSELGECYVGSRPGPDDPPRRSPPVIDAVPNPPAAPVAPKYDYDKEQSWKDYVLPDGNISPTPFGSGRKFWGPV